tara:strand:- start:49 stop:954 length:906 start_codon:yes stop_codon:yes gene_type:complete
MINLKINKCLLVNLNKGVNMKTQKKEVLATSEIKRGEVVNSENVKFDTTIVKNAVDKLDTKKLTTILQSALNVSENLYKWLPKLADEVAKKIKEYNANLDETSIKLKDQKRFDTFKELRAFCYGLIGYDRSDKNKINKAFEHLVDRGIKGGLMIVNGVGSLEVKDDELQGVSKEVKPTIPQKNINKKIKKKFIDVKNTSNELIPVSSGLIDEMWARKYGTRGSGGSKSTLKTSANKFYEDIQEIYNLAEDKNYDKFYSKMSNETLEIILDIKALLSDDVIRNTWAYCEKNLQANGSIKKAS